MKTDMSSTGLKQELGTPDVRAKRKQHRSWLNSFVAVLVLTIVIIGLFIAGYLPKAKRQAVLASEANTESETIPPVNVAVVERSAAKTELSLPGTMQAIAEAPVMARTSGYVKRRLVDIGDSVQSGQVLAEIEAPELDQQIRQAVSSRDQAGAALEQSEAGLRMARSNQGIAKITADRWRNLVDKGAVSRQENDSYQAVLESQNANVQASEKAIQVAKSNLAAVEANLERMNQLKSYQQVRSPFAGIITVRNIEAGTLVTEGSTLLYRVAQPGTLRVFVNIPQPDADAVHDGMPATVAVQGSPEPPWNGKVTRTAKALDPTSRTMLAEIQATNAAGKLMPGMFVLVGLSVSHSATSLLIPGDTLVVRSNGPQVALVDQAGTVHFRRIELGRDLGSKLEVISGVGEGDRIVINPGDTAKEGAKVKPILSNSKASVLGGRRPTTE